MKNPNKTIWIDLDNTPHVYFFRPIINELKKREYEVILTARRCAQTCELANFYKLDYMKVGSHHGRNKFLKATGLIQRALLLSLSVRSKKPALALSHGSRAQIIASNLLGVKNMMIVDYEFAKAIPFFRHDMIVIPEVVSRKSFLEVTQRVLTYPGIKEDVYIPFFTPDKTSLSGLELSPNSIIVTVRPPASDAHYHNPQSDIMFKETISHLMASENVQAILLPRNEKQKSWMKDTWKKEIADHRLVIPENAIDGLSMMYFSDLVISGGGTMNREAAALEVPVYSIFKGRIGAVDKYLSETGRLVILDGIMDIKEKIILKKRDVQAHHFKGQSKTLEVILDNIERSTLDGA